MSHPLFRALAGLVAVLATGCGGGGSESIEPVPSAEPEPYEALPVQGRTALVHDVVDAEYSGQLERIVMVSSAPTNALYVFDPVSGTEQAVALDYPPAAVSVSPDGLRAAVAHDGHVTVVDLALLNVPLANLKTVLNASANLKDVLLAGNGYAYTFDRVESWQNTNLRSIHIATNTETLGGSDFYLATGTLHVSGTKLYVAGHYLSGFDISGGPAQYEWYRSSGPDYEVCQRLWEDEGGVRLYSECGHTFRTADDVARDGLYGGGLDLVDPDPYENRIRSLSHSAERKELAVLEEQFYPCEFGPGTCYTRLSLHESDHLNLKRRYSLAPITHAGTEQHQRGLFIFHSGDGSSRYLISRIPGAYFVSTVTVSGDPLPPPDPRPVGPISVLPSDEYPLVAAPLTDFTALPHNIVDAEYSSALDALVMVANFPASAVYVRDTATGAERMIPLPRRPTSLSLGADGLHAAVGHDGLVTIVDLAAAGAAAPILVDVSTLVVEAGLTGDGYVHAVSAFPQESHTYSVDIAANTEAKWYGYTPYRMLMHPSGTKMYTGGPSRASISPGRIQHAYSHSAPVNDCGDVWFGEGGTRIFTACGDVFSTSDVQADDLVMSDYSLPLTPPVLVYLIVSLSESTEAQQVVFLENHIYYCTYVQLACSSHVSVNGNVVMNRLTTYSLSHLARDGQSFTHEGMFVFHNNAGDQRFVVGRLHGIPGPDPYSRYYVSRLQ